MVLKPELDKLVNELDNWISTQPHLPQAIGEMQFFFFRIFYYIVFNKLCDYYQLSTANT